MNLNPIFEIFYAKAPISTIKFYLNRKYNEGNFHLKDHIEKIDQGIILNNKFERNYKFYDDFISNIIENPMYNGKYEGFFNYFVDERGLKFFDEKEVDVRIVIRYMESLYKYDADSICIVSSDQDFFPLHDKSKEFNVRSFQADVAKFNKKYNVGKKIVSMTENYISGFIDPSWPLGILTESMSSEKLNIVGKHRISEDEIHALCKLHNEMNDFHIKIEIHPDGTAGITLSKPKKS